MMSLEEAWNILDDAEILCDAESIQATIVRLAQEIGTLLHESNPMILVIMKGGMFFAGQLLPMLRFPLEVEYAHASRYGSKLSGGEVRWTIAPPAASKGTCGRGAG